MIFNTLCIILNVETLGMPRDRTIWLKNKRKRQIDLRNRPTGDQITAVSQINC